MTIRRRRRAGHALAWFTTAAMAVVAALPWIRPLRGRMVTIVRSLMPWATIPAVPVALLAGRSGRRAAAVAAGAVAATGVAASAPLVIRRRQPRPAAPARPLSILHANLLFDNIRMPEVAILLERVGADVLTFSEYTPHHARLLRASALTATYPHCIELAAALASGTALWSRYPVTADHPPATRHHTVVGDVEAPGGTLRVIVVHTQSPVVHHRQWSDDLAVLATVAVPDGAAVMTGDFNAGWWHPEFRAVLASGWRDVHQVVGRGLSSSWPVDRALIPPFIRLDHALVNDGVIVERVSDVDITGSDHRGLLVDVSVLPAG